MKSVDHANADPFPLDYPPCGFVVLDDAGTIRRANDTVCEWIGSSYGALAGQPVTALFGLAGSVVFETSLLPLLRMEQQVSGVSLDLITGEGAKVPVMLSADSQGSGAERVSRLFFLKSRARREFERELIAARADAESRLALEQRQGEVREQFIAILGHDLRNPLAAMSSAIRLLSRSSDHLEQEEILRLMKGSIQRMSRLIDNVMDFARVRLGGGLSLTLHGGNLETVVLQAIEELQLTRPDRVIEASVELDHSVKCDAWRIGQLVSNLLGNALVYGDPSKPIAVVAKSNASAAMEISVSNFGDPIPDSSLENLFKPFERGDGEAKQGLGLGLYISHEIALAHGGELTVETGDQTRFSFRMPV